MSVNHPSNPCKSSRGYTSDSETHHTVHEVSAVASKSSLHLSSSKMSVSGNDGEQIQKNSSSEVIENDTTDVSESYEVIHKLPTKMAQTTWEKSSLLISPLVLSYEVVIGSRDPVTLEQAVDCLAFLIRDPAHITPDNFEVCDNFHSYCFQLFMQSLITSCLSVECFNLSCHVSSLIFSSHTNFSRCPRLDTNTQSFYTRSQSTTRVERPSVRKEVDRLTESTRMCVHPLEN